MKHKYPVLLEAQEEGGFHVFCPSFPGCHSESETIEEALANTRDTSTEVKPDAQVAVHPA